jgi:hypothetical protein
MTALKPSEITGQIVDLLMPLPSEDRQRIVAASLMLLGEQPVRAVKAAKEESSSGVDDDGDDSTLPAKAKTWQKQNALTATQLSQVFHTTGDKTDVIVGDMPGKNKKEQTLNAYVLTGLAQLLSGGDPTFTDKDARSLCTTAGCYDATNHTKALNDKGNWFTGSKDKGWTLTAPGLKHGATLIKELAGNSE